jgi:SPP1 gp7 family putative phage head morphogenesis protein
MAKTPLERNAKYWDERAVRRLTDAEKQSDAYIKRIQKMYDQANRNIQRDIEDIYRNYSKATGMDVQSLKELLTASETDKLWAEMKRKGLDKYVKGNYKARISRLEKMQAQIYAKAKEIYPKEALQHTMCYEGVVNSSYYKAIYDAQMGTGFDFAFSHIDDNMVTALLNEPWSGANYSARIWGNTDILAESLSEIIGGALLSGQSIEKTSRQIRERFGVAKHYAERLVRTETNHFNNEADAMAYEEMDVDKYVFLATLDTRTSTKCQEMDNQVIPLAEREVGKNFPPLHPNCRSKTRAYMGEEIEKTLKRRARNPITGKTEVIDNMSYEEWAKKHDISEKNTEKQSKQKTDTLKKQPKNGTISDKGKFPKAKTIEDAQNYAEKFAVSVSFAGGNVDGANTVNETLEHLTAKYPTKKLGGLKTNGRLKRSNARANFEEIEIKTSYLNENGQGDPSAWGLRVEANKKTLDRLEKRIGNPRYNQKQLKKVMAELEEENKFKRWSVSQSYGLSGTITHEYGHVIADQYLGMINGDLANPALSYDPDNKLYQAQMRVSFAFAKARKTGDIYNISKYANKNSDEFFAETFAMYDKGEELPDYIVSMIEEVLSFGKL